MKPDPKDKDISNKTGYKKALAYLDLVSNLKIKTDEGLLFSYMLSLGTLDVIRYSPEIVLEKYKEMIGSRNTEEGLYLFAKERIRQRLQYYGNLVNNFRDSRCDYAFPAVSLETIRLIKKVLTKYAMTDEKNSGFVVRGDVSKQDIKQIAMSVRYDTYTALYTNTKDIDKSIISKFSLLLEAVLNIPCSSVNDLSDIHIPAFSILVDLNRYEKTADEKEVFLIDKSKSTENVVVLSNEYPYKVSDTTLACLPDLSHSYLIKSQCQSVGRVSSKGISYIDTHRLV